MRRCREKRVDFTHKDNASVFPIAVREGGSGFGFCPGKATWYPDVKNLFDILILAAETGHMLFPGGLADQPDWAVEVLSWFVSDYRELQFNKRTKAIFGSKKDEPQAAARGGKRGSNN